MNPAKAAGTDIKPRVCVYIAGNQQFQIKRSASITGNTIPEQIESVVSAGRKNSKMSVQNRVIHECIIGNMWRSDHSRLVTLSDLKRMIESDNERIEWAKHSPSYHLVRDMLPVGYTLADYGNLRRRCGLQHFKHCPECGIKIDWQSIRKM